MGSARCEDRMRVWAWGAQTASGALQRFARAGEVFQVGLARLGGAQRGVRHPLHTHHSVHLPAVHEGFRHMYQGFKHSQPHAQPVFKIMPPNLLFAVIFKAPKILRFYQLLHGVFCNGFLDAVVGYINICDSPKAYKP